MSIKTTDNSGYCHKLISDLTVAVRVLSDLCLIDTMLWLERVADLLSITCVKT